MSARRAQARLCGRDARAPRGAHLSGMSAALTALSRFISLKTQFLALAENGLSQFSHINYSIDADGVTNAPKIARHLDLVRKICAPKTCSEN